MLSLHATMDDQKSEKVNQGRLLSTTTLHHYTERSETGTAAVTLKWETAPFRCAIFMLILCQFPDH